MSETARPIAIFRTTRPAVRLAGFIATVLAFTAVYTLKAQAQDLTQAAPEVQTVAPRAHAIPAGSGRSFTEASVFAAPGLECKVYPVGGNSARAVRVYTDSDGFARFYALRAAAGDKTRALTMDCVDAKGKPSTYPVDLTADETFVPRPLDLESEPGIDRPALTGDPLAYPQSELIQAGYGLRPDPATSPEAYQRWLNSATRPARMLTSKRPRPATQKVNQTASPYWTGTAITGKQSYISVEGNISVPKVIANGDETGYDVGDNDVHVAVWNGLGGFGTGSGLIQGGYQIDVDESVLSFDTFREYCCGNPNSNGYKGDFSPKSAIPSIPRSGTATRMATSASMAAMDALTSTTPPRAPSSTASRPPAKPAGRFLLCRSAPSIPKRVVARPSEKPPSSSLSCRGRRGLTWATKSP